MGVQQWLAHAAQHHRCAKADGTATREKTTIVIIAHHKKRRVALYMEILLKTLKRNIPATWADVQSGSMENKYPMPSLSVHTAKTRKTQNTQATCGVAQRRPRFRT